MAWKNAICVLIFLFSIVHGKSQEVKYLSSDVIKKNKVYKCIEHTYKDSALVEEDTTYNRYVIFDREGLKTEQNFGEGGLKQVYFMYDASGRESMFMWSNRNSIPPVYMVHINNYDEKGELVGHCVYWDGNDPDCTTYEPHFYSTDSIVKGSRKTMTILDLWGEQKRDTLNKSIYYYNNGLLDSLRIYDFRREVQTQLFTYRYNSDKVLLSIKSVVTASGKIFSEEEHFYLPNGLLDYLVMRTTYHSNSKKELTTDYSKLTFEYFYWE